MAMGIRTWTVVLVIMWMSAVARADAPPPIADAIKQAASAKKPLLIEFHAKWCGPCKQFEAKTLPDARVQKALEAVVFVRYDVDDSVGEDAAAKYGIDSYPTFLAVDAKGVAVIRHRGAPLGEKGIAFFVELIDRARIEALDEASVRDLVKTKRTDPSALLTAARWFVAHDHEKDAIATYELLSTHKQATAGQRLDATSQLVALRRRGLWTRQLLAEKLGLVRADPANARIDDLVIATVDSDVKPDESSAVWKSVLAATQDPARLNSLIYGALAAGANQQALEAAKRLVESERSAQYIDTLAECYHACGERSRALATSQEAIELTGYNVGLRRQLLTNRERFDRQGGESDEVRQARLRAADLWKRMEAVDQLADHVADPDKETRPAEWRDTQQKMMQQMRAEHDLAMKIAQECATQAADNDEAVARVALDNKGIVTKVVLLLESRATPALRTCLTKQLEGAVVVPEPIRKTTRLWIDFHHAH